MVAFDALILSEMLGSEVLYGKVIHGDDHIALKVKTSASSSEVRKLAAKIGALLSAHSAPDLILNRHCAECEFQTQCKQKAIEADDLSLLSGITAKERAKHHCERIVGRGYKRDRQNLWTEGIWTGRPGMTTHGRCPCIPMLLLCGNFELTKLNSTDKITSRY